MTRKKPRPKPAIRAFAQSTAPAFAQSTTPAVVPKSPNPVSIAEKTSAASPRPASEASSLWKKALLRLVAAVMLFLGYLTALLGFTLISCNQAPAKLAGFDALALAGAKVKLAAKLEYDGPGFINPDVHGVDLEFYALGPFEELPALWDKVKSEPAKLPEGKLAGGAKTVKDGIASLEMEAPKEPGNHLYRVRLKEPERLRLKDPEVYLIVSVTPADQPVLITDIDNTICQTKLSATFVDKPEESPPLDDAAAVLAEASKSYRLVYLTARPTALCHRTRNWLSTHRFPPGPVFFRDLWSELKKFNNESDYKAEFIQKTIKPTWKNLPWGAGNTLGDAKAYQANSIAAILINPDLKDKAEIDKLGPNLHPVPDWKTAQSLIRQVKK